MRKQRNQTRMKMAVIVKHLHLHILFAKSYEDIQQIPVQGAKIKMSEYVCAAKVINNFGIIIMK